MIKSFFLLISFFVIILFNIASATHSTKAERDKNIRNLTSSTQDKDTTKKGKITVLLDKLIKPFKFRSNEKARVDTWLHDYINKDTVAAKKDLNYIKAQLPALSSQLSKIQGKLDSMSNSLAQAQSNSSKSKTGGGTTPANNTPKPKDTTAKTPPIPKPVLPNAGANQLASTDIDSKAGQQKINLIRRLYQAPVLDTSYSKDHDSTIIRQFDITHTTQVLGFYADTSRSGITNIDFKLITTFVYAINVDKASFGLGKNAALIDSASKAGCNIMLSLYTTKPENTLNFLNDNNAKDNLIDRSIELLKRTRATGININFTGLDKSFRTEFVTFISSMYNSYQATPEQFKINITIPGSDKCAAYDIKLLDKLTQNFLIDFTTKNNTPGALASLSDGSNNSIESCFSFYLAQGIAASKFILSVPYYGAMWLKQPKKFLRYISYSNVRKGYSDSVKIYNPGESAAFIQVDSGKPPFNIWYDDEKTLGEKYDFAISRILGGVAIKFLGDDAGYGELQDELAFKFVKIDTCVLGVTRNNFKTTLTNFLAQLTENPCDHPVNHTYSRILGIINLIVLALVIITALILLYQVKMNGDAWKYKQPMIYILIGIFVVWTFILLMWLFFWDKNPFFGQSSTHCINISFVTLCLILFAGTATGFIIRWVYQLNTTNEKP